MASVGPSNSIISSEPSFANNYWFNYERFNSLAIFLKLISLSNSYILGFKYRKFSERFSDAYSS